MPQIDKETTTELQRGLRAIFMEPSTTYEQQPDGSCNKVVILVQKVSKTQFQSLAILEAKISTDFRMIASGSGISISFSKLN